MVTYDQVIAKRQFVLYGKMLVISCEMVMEIKLRTFELRIVVNLHATCRCVYLTLFDA